ncbi:chorion peroxidase-like isoform X2 [Penaeus japonicus]|uniref:chorion peroxidase-like isoform X2 n=1 Tax=Penaeus japonicus TaxID=27405 RepID=UPI001C716672|nr:chorion peroxidase-like isoform X2 [Penaeus japonicus]
MFSLHWCVALAAAWACCCPPAAEAQRFDFQPVQLDPTGGIFGAGAESTGGDISVLDALDIGLERAQALKDRDVPAIVAFLPPSPGAAAGGGIAASPPFEEAPSRPPDRAGQLLFSFRRAEPEAKKEAECTGRILLEASKTLVQRNRIPPSEVSAVLAKQSQGLPPEECQRRVEKLAGCDLVEPPTPSCSASFPYRSIDGSCNNLANPKWGAARIPFRRFIAPAYEDGVDSMRGSDRILGGELPSPRTVSVMLQKTEQRPQRGLITLMVMQWGQFTDHDIVHTPESALAESGKDGELTEPVECCESGQDFPYADGVSDCQPIDVLEDPLHRKFGRACMKFVRSLIANQGCVLGPREQLNQITAYLDGSSVYGSLDRVAEELRAHVGGRLNWTNSPAPGRGHLMPFVECEGGEGGASGGHCFKAGDLRSNEQPALASMHTLWVREHNAVAAQLSLVNPHWDDDTLYEETRRIVSALIQQITYRDFLPIILGNNMMKEFDLYPLTSGHSDTYNASEDASVINAFGTAAYRFGHTLVDDMLQGEGKAVPLVGNFFNPEPLFHGESRPSALLEGLATMNAQPADAYLVPSLTNNLFKGHNDPVGMDLMALNIQRGRDHGLPPYTEWRRACGLPPVSSFADLIQIMSPSVVEGFENLYPNVDEIDLFPAGLGEKAVPDGLLGPTFTCIIAHQFAKLKRGDRFWYENRSQPKPFTEEQLASIREITLSSVICHNTILEYMQPNPFFSANAPGNRPRPCASFPVLKAELWREEGTSSSSTSSPTTTSSSSTTSSSMTSTTPSTGTSTPRTTSSTPKRPELRLYQTPHK